MRILGVFRKIIKYVSLNSLSNTIKLLDEDFRCYFYINKISVIKFIQIYYY